MPVKTRSANRTGWPLPKIGASRRDPTPSQAPMAKTLGSSDHMFPYLRHRSHYEQIVGSRMVGNPPARRSWSSYADPRAVTTMVHRDETVHAGIRGFRADLRTASVVPTSGSPEFTPEQSVEPRGGRSPGQRTEATPTFVRMRHCALPQPRHLAMQVSKNAANNEICTVCGTRQPQGVLCITIHGEAHGREPLSAYSYALR